MLNLQDTNPNKHTSSPIWQNACHQPLFIYQKHYTVGYGILTMTSHCQGGACFPLASPLFHCWVWLHTFKASHVSLHPAGLQVAFDHPDQPFALLRPMQMGTCCTVCFSQLISHPAVKLVLCPPWPKNNGHWACEVLQYCFTDQTSKLIKRMGGWETCLLRWDLGQIHVTCTTWYTFFANMILHYPI